MIVLCSRENPSGKMIQLKNKRKVLLIFLGGKKKKKESLSIKGNLPEDLTVS